MFIFGGAFASGKGAVSLLRLLGRKRLMLWRVKICGFFRVEGWQSGLMRRS